MDKRVGVILMGLIVVFVFMIAIKQFFVLREQVYTEAYFEIENEK